MVTSLKHNKKNQTLQEMKRAQLQSFFNSTATLMTEQLQVKLKKKKILNKNFFQGLALTSIADYNKMIKTSSEHDSSVRKFF